MRPPVRTNGRVLWELLPGQLYLSGTLSKMLLAARRELLAEHGVTLVVNVGRHDPGLEELGPEHHYFRVPDSAVRVPREQLAEPALRAAAHVYGGGRALVMCWGGRNRSALLAALVVRCLRQCSGQEAYDLIRGAKASTFYNELYGEYVRGLPVPRPRAEQTA